MTEPDLAALLRSPALALEPPADLMEGVRRGARRTRRRRAAGTVGLATVLVAGAVTVGPQLVGARPDPNAGQVALAPDSRFPEATGTVLQLAEVNGGAVLSWFEGTRWCTASSRADVARSCSRGVGSVVQPFAFVRGPGNESVTVDNDVVVAGLLGDGVAQVRVRVSGGRELLARSAQPQGFLRPVWWVRVPSGAAVGGYTALDASGVVVAQTGTGR